MDGLSQKSPSGQLVGSYLADTDWEELDSKQLTSEEWHAIYTNAFAINLADEGLRSPDYYHDKSQCISFHEDAWPAEIGIYKAQTLKRGYIEPEDLIGRLNELKPSENFTLHKYPHRQMEWDKSPVSKTPGIIKPTEPEWFFYQIYGVLRFERQLGFKVTERIRQEMQSYWDKVCDIDLTPIPRLKLLEHISHSASGTVFPRYLVKGLYKLWKSVNDRGNEYYDQEYEKAKDERSKVTQHWQAQNPDCALADHPLSIYRTWPSELMARLDTVDQEAMRCGSRRYVADLIETEKKMQKLVLFWNECGLITGTRTPPSPPWPDPKAKLRNLNWPAYLRQRLNAIHKEFGFSKEGTKRRIIELARWKEAVINTEVDPCTSEIPLSPSLDVQLDIAWQSYGNIFDREDVEDEMIAKLGKWRKSNMLKVAADRTRNETNFAAFNQQSSLGQADEGTRTNEDAESQCAMESPPIAKDKIHKATPSLSRSDVIALGEASRFLRTPFRKRLRHRMSCARPTIDGTTWSERLRPRPALENASPQSLKAQWKRAERLGALSSAKARDRLKNRNRNF